MSEPQVIQMYAAREQIYPREAKGRYATWRWVCLWLTQLAFYGLPWLNWNGRQALLFDLTTRKFYIFGVVLWPQDFIYLAALLIICAYLLFLVTAIAGRVWCGFACPQTVYTEIFMWVERKIEGTRSARMALDRQGPSLRKTAKKTIKHLAWGAIALWTGFTFVGYFTPIQELAHEVSTLNFGPWEWFWVLFYSLATYGNAGWLREQVCKYMCPYARFQSAMFDQDTLIVTYDAKRGEPRGALSKKTASGEAHLGACIDCTLCVQVCPTGIDIRQGLQYECIGCAACVDACNSVMDKIDRPRGLVRYSTDHALANNFDSRQIRRRAMRPRVLVYTAILALITIAVCSSLFLRTPLKLDVIRDRGSLGREVEDGMIENVYRLQIMNTSEQRQTYRITVDGLPGLSLLTRDEVTLGPTETLAWPIRLRAPHGVGAKGSNKIGIALTSVDDASLHVHEKAVFFVPR
ncbi:MULTISPECIES: cytochrome c oxidase accessory protein CcoG [unclassified Janthinobacterium]|uniref:cytochrome c oxidase accessory protein CcoG n=1 Tax=unclassified Janthinobacterium TaxID=2610881 RepID=UPI001614807D|nr:MULTISPECIES: cytochrome c oxidase accessory protein CcoG [unclassified Janthinobacterium]MBB5609628.1 cytochrome c oxidase accessory protein FixG [Janthinobacterium sp. S3T4]MBB5614800.1 cytochrome c oxidase accessory protein FixG [Janthinobacterium sp. S3M3]